MKGPVLNSSITPLLKKKDAAPNWCNTLFPKIDNKIIMKVGELCPAHCHTYNNFSYLVIPVFRIFVDPDPSGKDELPRNAILREE